MKPKTLIFDMRPSIVDFNYFICLPYREHITKQEKLLLTEIYKKLAAAEEQVKNGRVMATETGLKRAKSLLY